MRRKDLVTTTMALTLAVFMSAVSVGCGSDTSENVSISENDAVVSTEVSTEISEDRYEIVDVQIPYEAMVKKNTNLIEDLETNTESSVSVAKEAYVTVTAEVYCEGVLQDFYRVELADGSKGFVEGRYLDFNVDTVQDYADSLVEVEGGDGEEATEVIETEVTESVEEEVPFEPYTMYTNTACNVRSQATKESELVGNCSVNTSVTVIGIEGNWSKVEYNGLQAYIKSSLLSDTKVEVRQPSNTSASNQGVEPSQPAPQPQQTAPSQPDTSGLPADFFDDAYTAPVGGGTTGSHSVGMGGAE